MTIIGTGYVGLTTGVTLAFAGHEVTCVDKDRSKLSLLAQGMCPIYEPGLDEMLLSVRHNMSFSDAVGPSVADAEVVLIAVGTPQTDTGETDVSYVLTAAKECAAGFREGSHYIVVMKSTVPVGTSHRIVSEIRRVLDHNGIRAQFEYVSNPEFLREGFALCDTLYPDRVVIGTDSVNGANVLRRLYEPILNQNFVPPSYCRRSEELRLPAYIITDPTSAEMIKYAANAFLTVKISFINEIFGLCERVGADVTEVARGIGADSRIGPRFLSAGLGWGGSCFSKDSAELVALGAQYGYELPIVNAARYVNKRQRKLIIEKLQAVLKVLSGRTIGVLGLAFKPDTDDIRESPALEIVRDLIRRGAYVRVHDPVAMANARHQLKDAQVEFVDDLRGLFAGCDALVLATEWSEYLQLEWGRVASEMRTPILVDGRNAIDPVTARDSGFVYIGTGR